MINETLGQIYAQELESEARASRRCLERIPEKLFTWKPHEKSLTMIYTALIVAEIPKWITHIVEISEIDFATFKHFQPKTTDELVSHFDENLTGALSSLQKVTDEELLNLFYLKNSGVTLMSSSKKENISSSINHLVHHRGQLTVYMRLNDIPVPSIYGPSADEKIF